MVANENVLDNVGAEHDVNGIEQGVENVLVLAEIPLLILLVAI